MLASKARVVLNVFLFLAVFILLEGCTSRVQKPAPVVVTKVPIKPVAPDKMGPHKVGLLLPLSGPNRSLGQALQNAAELALFESGHDGLELVIEDTLGTPEGARLATQKALNKGAELILGPVFYLGALESSKIASPRQIKVLSFTNDKKAAGPHTYVLGFDPQEQVKRVLMFASSRNKKTLIAFVPQNDYGILAEKALKHQENLGTLKIIHLERYDPRNPSVFSKKRFPQADMLFIAEGGHNLSRIISTLLYHENQLNSYQLIGTGQWDTPLVRSNHSLTGAWFASPDPSLRLRFEDTFQQAYGYLPPRLAALSYDAVSMIAVLTKRFPKTPFTQESLTYRVGFSGLDGLFRLTPQGTVERGLAVLEIQLDALKVLDLMPKKF